MRLHLIQGQAGCSFAVAQGAVAVIVDALRASATAAMLCEQGAREILFVREVEDAWEARRKWPDALLFGERQGLPPEGFDGGNSPLEAGRARGRRVVFTTTTGAKLLVAAWGAAAVVMGSTVNASAVVAYLARRMPTAVVLIPAGLDGDPQFDAQEDWTAAAHIAERLLNLAGKGAEIEVDMGRDLFSGYVRRIREEGIASLFHGAPHAANLRLIGKQDDITFCAQTDICGSVPEAVGREDVGIRVRAASQDD